MIAHDEVMAAALWVTSREGGALVSDPALSKWGLSLRYHPEFGEAGIRNATQAQAAQVFASPTYWLEVWNALPTYLVIPLLSFAVLEGVGQGCYALQRALSVRVDGKIGPQTIAAASAAKPAVLLEEFFGACLERFEQSPRWILDGKGWCRRQFAASLQAQH